MSAANEEGDNERYSGAALDGGASAAAAVAAQSACVESPRSLWLRAGVQTLLLLAAGVLYMLAFAGPGLGFGLPVYLGIVQHEALLDFIALGALATLLALYLLDFSYWTGAWFVVKAVLLTLVGLAFAAVAVLAAKRYPGSAIAFYVLIFPGFCWLVKYSFYRHLHTALFMKSMSYALLFSSLVALGVWLGWLIVRGYWWGNTTKWLFGNLVDCDVPVSPEVPLTDENYDCLQAWVLWAAPFLAACNAFVFAMLARILSHSLRQTDKPLTVALKLFLAMLAMAAVCLWVAASIAGAGLGVGGAVQLFVGVFTMVLSGVVISTVGWKRLQQQLMNVPLIRQVTASLLTDWFKAIFLIAFGPVLPFYFFLSLVNQLLRKVMPFGYHIEDADERKLWLTAAAAGQLRVMMRWRWTSVLVKIMWFGLFYVIVNVGVAKIVSLLMSVINEALSNTEFYLVVIIFYLIGLGMFLLPPVPGLPVYLSGGIILGKQGEEVFGSFFGALAFACMICFSIKLLAIFMQQRLIGQEMSRFVGVRKLVGVNSISIRAIRKVLEVPGLSVAKVSILIGGPDWPTSVLTGILRLSLWQMQLGSLPVFFLVVPMTLAGGFLLKTSEGGLWGPVSSVTLAVAGLSQLVSLLAAMYYISETAEEHYEELAAMPDDEEVAEADRLAAEKVAITLARQSWFSADFPFWMRLLLVSGAFAMSACVYILAIAGDQAFVPFAVNDSVDDKLAGNVANIIKDLGWVCIGLLGYTVLVIIIFGRWTAYRIKHLPADFVVPTSIRDEMKVNPVEGGDVGAAKPKKAKGKGGIAASVAKATQKILHPGQDADMEASEAERRQRDVKEKLRANAEYKDEMVAQEEEAKKETPSKRRRKKSTSAAKKAAEVEMAPVAEPKPAAADADVDVALDEGLKTARAMEEDSD